MAKTIHLSLSVRGTLLKSDRELRGWLMDDSGRELSPRAARMALMDELAKGREVLPCGPVCEGWSYITGCPGHEDA